jgi:putative methionine-R-sulfoxide reductase with GAF domain
LRKRYRPAREVLAEIERTLSSRKPSPRGPSPLQEVVDTLGASRGYFWTGVYLVLGRKVVRQAFHGPVPPCHEFELNKGNVGTTAATGVLKVVPDVTKDPTYSMCFVETKSEIVVPIKIAGRILGVIDVESDRPNAFGPEGRVLLKKVAEKLARFLTSRGKYLVRKAREQQAEEDSAVPESAPAFQPASEKMETSRRAAAGEKSRR